MNINIEQVDKLKERANVSYADAKQALEECNGDLLESVIYLEKQGKVQEGSVGSYDSRSEEQASASSGTGGGAGGQKQKSQQRQYQKQGESFGDVMRKIWSFLKRLIHKCNINHFEVYREGRCVLSVPVTLLVLCLLFFFYITLPVLIIALFFGCSYKFRGPDLGKDNINEVMDGAANAAETLKRSVQEASSDNNDTQK